MERWVDMFSDEWDTGISTALGGRVAYHDGIVWTMDMNKVSFGILIGQGT